MKKLFTLIAAALMAVGASAQKTNLSLAAGWDTSIEADLTGDVEFNFKNSYACIYMDITEVDLATYPSYEIVVSEDTPVTNLQLYVKSDAGENWSGSFSAGTTVCSFVPETATKILAIGLQACNVADLGKVEIVSASLIDKDGNKKALSYKMPESWAADVVTPVTKGNIAFTSGGQWTAANLKGGEGMALPVKITFNADEFPANVQLQIITSKADETTYSKNREVSSELTAGEKTHTVTIEALEEGETIKSIAVQNKEKQDPFKIMNVTATIEPAGGDEPAATGKSWDFTKTSADVIAALDADANWVASTEGTGDNAFTRYQYKNEIAKETYVDLASIGFAPGAGIEVGRVGGKMEGGKTIRIDANNRIQLNCSNGVFKIKDLKAGDVVKIQFACASNSEDRTFTVTNADKATVTATKDQAKIVETLTIAADGDLVLQQSKAINIYAIAVNGELPTGIQNIKAATKTIENNVIYNLAGQRVNESYKGIVIKNGKKYIQK